MTNAAKAKGTAFESAVVKVLQEEGLTSARRQPQHGAKDKGDLEGVPGFAVECKNEARLNLAGYVDQANAEAANAGKAHGVAVVKRRGKHARQAYAVMDLQTFARVAQRLAEAEDLLAALGGLLDEP